MSHPYVEYLREVEKAARRRRFSAVSLIIPAGALMFASAVLWSHLATRDVITRAEGEVIPAARVQMVQNTEGGILRDVLVTEGERVKEGQVVAHLDDTSLKAETDGQKVRRAGLAATAARLDAEAGGGALQIPAEVQSLVPGMVAHEKALFKARQAELASGIDILNQELTQRQSEVAVLDVREKTLSRGLSFLTQELTMGRDLAAQGLKSRIELLKLERQVSDAEGERDSIHDRLPAARAAVDEAKRKIDERRAVFETQALQELTKIRTELAAVDASLITLAEGSSRRDIRAPVDGVVKRVAVASLGGAIQPGATLMEVVPANDALLIEGKVRVSDLPRLRLGQTASVRIGSSQIAGNGIVTATVEEVDADPQPDRSGEPVYRVRLRSAALMVPSAEHARAIQAGMTATAEIFTGRQSVLDYVLQPIRTARFAMLREQ